MSIVRSLRRSVRKRASMCLVCGEDTQRGSHYCRAHTKAGKPRSKMSYASQAAVVLQERQTSARKKNQ